MSGRGKKTYDIIVVGGGHAGIEAALSACRMGCGVLLVTLKKKHIGTLSCNPAMGGIGKGQLIKEIDALGGQMGQATDYSALQYKTLNASKGQAVRSSRVQVDSKKYSSYMLKTLSNEKKLDILEGNVNELKITDSTVYGVLLEDGTHIKASYCIIACGTFLNGVMHIGMKTVEGGRIEDIGSNSKLSDFLGKHFQRFRFKTGTCARLFADSIDFTKMDIQPGDKDPKPISFRNKKVRLKKQLPCYVTYTNQKTHSVITKNMDKSPLYSGIITGRGVRYCPSLEDKIVKFAHHPRHQIFLEPEESSKRIYYPNGISTSLPETVQDSFIRTIPGLKHVKIQRYGYGIEHDVINPLQLSATLETKKIKNLFIAGQINGTTGYEEAAAQGLIAGINTALKIKKMTPLILDRASSYIGVLIDDLVTKGTNEPYRMFTSRVEYRLLIREDNADSRLSPIGYRIGLIKKDRFDYVNQKHKAIEACFKKLKSINIKPDKKTNNALRSAGCERLTKPVNLINMLKRPEVNLDKLNKSGLIKFKIPELIKNRLENDIKYEGYIKKQLIEVKKFKNLEKIVIPKDLDIKNIPGLSNEIKEKLIKLKPKSLGQASRISGVTPVAIACLMVYLKK